ncbi:Ferrochelatase-2, chloroplastic [Capsicum chinense]|nr:Ferrochelatase-2, chloroplastic [Capsicum chinense]
MKSLPLLGSTIVTSLNFSFQDSFAKCVVTDEMVVMESKVDDTYFEVNHVFDDSSQRIVLRELQPISPFDIIHLPKLFRFLQQLLAQLIFVLQIPKIKVGHAVIGGDVTPRKEIIERASALKMELEGKEVRTTVCIAWLQGSIKSVTDLIERELRNFSRLEEIMVFLGSQGVPASYATGDKIIACLPTLSLYEFAALESCKNDHWYLNMSGSELEYGAAMGLSLLERFSDRLTLVLQ